MLVQDFAYTLPAERIAQVPIQPRDHSRLLHLDRQTGAVSHHHFFDLPSLLRPTDVLVRNNTRVIPARLFGRKTTGGAVEVLLTQRLSTSDSSERWECVTRPGIRVGQVISFAPTQLTATCVEFHGQSRVVELNRTHTDLFTDLETIGQTPLPPYIHWQGDDPAELRQLYQTTFAKIAGSAAAPTAGFHFTPELDAQLRALGIPILEVTLHVGLGTFLRVKVDEVAHHHMHGEAISVSAEVAEQLNAAKTSHRRIVAVGTTTTRTLESCWNEQTQQVDAQQKITSIFMYPPRKFQVVDALITNFHEPKSTLLMLVSAFVSQPNTTHPFTTFNDSAIGKAYQTAIDHHYRMLSFGDAMLIE